MNSENLLWMGRSVMYALAAFRVTYMLWAEDGPFDAFDWLRYKMGVTVLNNVRGDNGSMTGRMFNCPLCLSVWVSAVAVVCYALNVLIIDWISMVLAMSAVCVILMGYERNR